MCVCVCVYIFLIDIDLNNILLGLENRYMMLYINSFTCLY